MPCSVARAPSTLECRGTETMLGSVMKVLVVDAFDSFVYIIRQYLESVGAEPTVMRSNEVRAQDVRRMQPDAIVLGPGPGRPEDSGYVELVREFAGEVPIL